MKQTRTLASMEASLLWPLAVALRLPTMRPRKIKKPTIQTIKRPQNPTTATMENPQTGPDPAVMAAIDRGNKVVFFDVALGGVSDGPEVEDKSKPLGRIKLELFVKDVSFN